MSVPGQPQSQPPYVPPALEPQPSPLHRQRLAEPRAGLRSRTGCVVVPIITLLLGIGLSILALFLYSLSFAPDAQVIVMPLPSPGGDMVVQIGPAYITRVLQNDLRDSELGDIENVQVGLPDSDRLHHTQMMVTGDDHTSVLGFKMTRHVTFVAQLLIQDCQIHVHVLHADVGSIPVTGFATALEGQIDEQLQVKFDGLPPGFTYCIIGVRTKPEGLFVTLSATPKGTPSAIPTATPKVVPTAAPTATPKITPTATPKVIPTATPKVIPTAIPKATPKATPKPSP